LERERIRMFQDFRFGLKLLWKEKAFTITALLTLALCIGANTAIFTVLHAVILPLSVILLIAVHMWRLHKDGGMFHPDSKEGEKSE